MQILETKTPQQMSYHFEFMRGTSRLDLLDGDAFGEVSGFVHVLAAKDGGVVG
jgi:hypothetical protein